MIKHDLHFMWLAQPLWRKYGEFARKIRERTGASTDITSGRSGIRGEGSLLTKNVRLREIFQFAGIWSAGENVPAKCRTNVQTNVDDLFRVSHSPLSTTSAHSSQNFV